MSDGDSYLLRWRGTITGPHTLAVIERKLDEREVGMMHEIQCNGRWSTLEEFFSRRSARHEVGAGSPHVAVVPAAGAPAFAPTARVTALAGVRPCQHLVFAALGLLLGFSGAHNFYARRWPVGVAQALTSAATFFLGFGIFATWIWALLEIIFVQTDGKGVRLA